jgi:flagellar hook protein FlgE
MNFSVSLSGLSGAATALDVIGDNIANAQTIGFKSSKTRFADLLANAGANAKDINPQFTQGAMEQSGNPLDMAINGSGFFRFNNGGAISYSRDGEFQLAYGASTSDKRALVNSAGLHVTGYPADYTTDPQGVIMTSSLPGDVYIDPFMPALATTKVSLGVNLDARSGLPVAVPFAANDPQTYTGMTGTTVYDATGGTHSLKMYFSRTSTGNAWDFYTALDNGAPTGPVSLNFDTNGLMTNAMPVAAQTYTLSGGGSLSLALDLSGTVQYGSTFSVDSITQDGYGAGAINGANGFNVGNDGVIQAFYSNGQSRKVAQIVLANFVNPEALIRKGDNQWLANADPVSGSGKEVLDVPGGMMGMGTLQGAAREQSNVDLSAELVAMIEQQRNYQASAQTLKVLDQVLQNLVNAR